MKTVEHKLFESIRYSEKGKYHNADTIILFAPNRKQAKYALKIKQCIIRAFAKISKGAENQSQDDSSPIDFEKLTANEIILPLLSSDDFDYEKVIEDYFVKLLGSGIARINDDRVLQSFETDLISLDDLEELFGLYVKTFTLSSLQTAS